MTVTKAKIPNVKIDVSGQLERHRRLLENLGLARTDHGSQRGFIRKIASQFQIVTQAALNGFHDNDQVFRQVASLKLITTITKMDETFANKV
jgi:hypothetical protein